MREQHATSTFHSFMKYIQDGGTQPFIFILARMNALDAIIQKMYGVMLL